MVNARSRKENKARLESTEALAPPGRDGKTEAELQQSHVPSIVSTRKRKRGDVVDEQGGAARGTAALQNDVQDGTRGKPSSVHDATSKTGLTVGSGKAAMGGSDPRALTHQQDRKRGIHGAMERVRDSEINRPVQNNIRHDVTGKEAEVRYEEKRGKRKVLGERVRELGKEKDGNAVGDHSRAAIMENSTSLNRQKKRRNVLSPIYFPGQSSAEILSLAQTKRTRHMVRKDTDGETGAGRMKKRNRVRSKGKAEAGLIGDGYSAKAESSVVREGQTAGMPVDVRINCSKLGSSGETAELGRELDSKSHAPVEESPAAVGPNQAESKLSKVSSPRKNKKIIAEVNVVNESRGRLPKSTSPPITRAMKDVGLDPAGTAKRPPALREDPISGGSVGDPIEQAAVPMTPVETAIMQLRNRKKVGEANERPQKRAKKKQSNAPADTDTRQKDMNTTMASDAVLENRTANGIDGLGGSIDASKSDSKLNHTEAERNGNSSLNRVGENDLGPQVLSTEGVLFRSSKIDGQSGNEQQTEVSRHSVPPIKGGAKDINGELETSQTKKCTDGNGRRGGRLGRMKNRGKKKIDPGGSFNSEVHLENSGVDSVLEEKTFEPDKNGLQDKETRHCNGIEESGHLRPGPSNAAQAELAEQRIGVQNLDGVTAAAAGQSHKLPVELAEVRDKTGVEESMHLAETKGGCQQIDHDHLAPENLQGESQDGGGRKLETATLRVGPSKNTRGSKVDGRNNIGPTENSIKTKVRRGNDLGRWKKGRKKMYPGGLLKHSKSHVESLGLDSAPDKALEVSKTAMKDDQTHERTQVEESGHLGHRPSSEVHTGLREERADLKDVGAETSRAARKLEKPSELRNLGYEENIGVEMDGGREQIDHHDQVLRLPPDEGKDDGVMHTETVLPRKVPMRTRVLTRGRKVDGQSRIDSEMESGLQPLVSGHSDQPSKGRRKQKSEAATDKKAFKTGSIVPQAEDTCQRTPGEYSVLASPESNKIQMELGEQRIAGAAGSVENPSDLQSKGSGQENAIEPPAKLTEMERRSQENDHHDQALEKLIVESQDVGAEKAFEGVSSMKMSKKRAGRQGLMKVREEDVPVKDTSLHELSNGFTHVEQENVSEDAGKSVEVPGKRKRKKQGIGDATRPQRANIASPAPVENTSKSPELAEKSSFASKGRKGTPKPVNKVTTTDLQPSSEKTDLGLSIGDGDVNNEPHQNMSCNGAEKGQGQLSKGSPAPKRRKTGRSRTVTSRPLIIVDGSKVILEVGDPKKGKELSSGQGVVGRASLLDDVVKGTLEASQVGSPVEGNVHKVVDQGESFKCHHENQQWLSKALLVSNPCNICRSQVTVDGITSKDLSEVATVKDLSSEHVVTSDIIQSDCVRVRGESLNDAVKVSEKASQAGAELTSKSLEAQGEKASQAGAELTSKFSEAQGEKTSEAGAVFTLKSSEAQCEKASQAGAERTSKSSEAQGELQSGQLPVKKKKHWSRKDYRPKVEWKITTRAKRQGASNIETQGDKNGIVADAVTQEHVDVSPEVVSTTESNRDSVSTEEIDVPKEDLEQGEKFPAAPDVPSDCATESTLPPRNEAKGSFDSIPGEPACAAAKVGREIIKSGQLPHVYERRSGPKDDFAVACRAVEQELDVVNPMEVHKSLAPESPGKDVCALQEVEKSQEPRSDPTSHLNHFEEMKTPEQGKLDGQQDGQPESSTDTLLSDQLKNVKVPGVLSKHPASPDGPFALEDGTSLKLHCGQEKASSPDDHGDLNPEVSHSPSFERFSAEDLNNSTIARGAESISAPDKSESLTMVETSGPVVATFDLDPVTTTVESDPVATLVEPDPIATIVTSGPVATIVEADPVSATRESDAVNIAEGSNPIPTAGNSTVDITNSITTENVLESITLADKPDFDNSGTNSDSVIALDKSDSFTSVIGTESIAAVENSFGPVTVVDTENTTELLQLKTIASEIGSVGESSVRFTDSKSSYGESLTAEAVNSQQNQVTVEVPLEDFRLEDGNSAGSPLLQLSSSAEDSVEPVTENHGMQSPGGEAIQPPCWQHRGMSGAKIDTQEIAFMHRLDGRNVLKEREQSTNTSSPEELCEQPSTAKDTPLGNECAEACDGDSRFQKTFLDREDFHQDSHGKVAAVVQQGQPPPSKDWVGQPISDVSLQDAGVPSESRTKGKGSVVESEPSISPRGGACVELVSSNCPQLESSDQKGTVTETSDVIEPERSQAEGAPEQEPRVALQDHRLLNQEADLGVGVASNGDLTVDEQVVTGCPAESTAVEVDRTGVNSDSLTLRVSVEEDVTAGHEPLKLPSGLEKIRQTQSKGQMLGELFLKNFDVELEGKIEAHDKTKKVHAEVEKVPIEADIHTEAKQAHSKAEEMLAEVKGALAEAKEVNLNAEVNHVVEMIQAGAQDAEAEVQQMEADAKEVQVEAPEMQVEVQSGDGAEDLLHDSLNRSAGSVNVDTEGKQLDTEAKQMHVGAKEVQSQLERQTEEKDVNTEQEVDAEVKDLVADEVTIKSKHTKEGVSGLDSLVTTSTSQQHASNNREPSLVVSVPEEDVSRPFSLDIVLDLQTGAVTAPINTESVTVDTEKHIQLAGQVSHTQFNEQDTAHIGQLTSPVEVGGRVEGDALQPEELSDIQTETQEKDDPKNESLRLQEPVPQKSMAGVKGSLVSKKRKARTGIETTKEPEGGKDEDLPSRLPSKKKGFLLASTSIESGGMRIRPRPLDPDQSMPIFFEGHKDFLEYDGGSFYRWVQQQEEAKLKKPAVELAADGVSEGGGSTTVSKADLVKRRPIFIPLFRKLPDDQQTNSGLAERLEYDILVMQSSFPRPHAYLRHTKSAVRTRGQALGSSFSTVPSVYDMDDEDEKWLQGYNETDKQSGLDQPLSEDAFEQLMELFEREFYRICQISQTPRNPGDKGRASGHRGKMSDVDSSKRHSRMEPSRVLSLHERTLSPVQNGSEDCCICNGGENSSVNPVRRCQICSINVHESCYGICGNTRPNWCCRKCEAVVGGRAISSISCAICCKPGGAMKPTVDPSKWAHVACALYTNETFFVDTEAMEPVDGLVAVETRLKKQRERCGLCGAREGSCVRCSTRGCRAPFHISCGVSQGASFELRHTKQLVVGVRSYCPRHASIVPGANLDEGQCAPSRAGDAGELLPAVSTESSDTLEMRHVEQRNIVESGNRTEDAVGNGVGLHVSCTSKHKGLDRSESRRFFKKKRSGTRPRITSAEGATPSKLDASSRPHEISEKDVHGVSRTLPKSGSMLKENLQGVPQYMDESDPYFRPTAEEKLDSETVSAATSGCSSHLTSSTLENLDNTGKVTSNEDEVHPVNLVDKHKSVTGDAETSSLADKAVSDAVSLKLPSLETLDTNLAPPEIVKAVYSFWQSKRVKAKGPMLHELRQLQAAKSQGIFNKVVNRSSEFLPPVGHDSPARIPVTRRPRSVGRDPVLARFLEMRQHLEMVRSIAGNVVRREQLKLEDQKCLYEIAQQRLLLAKELPKTRRCLWCENTQNLLSCSSCPKAFCYKCFKHRRGYGVKGWIAASKLPKYVCNFCSGSTAQEGNWPDSSTNVLSTNFSEPRGTPVSRVAPVPGRLGDWNYGLEVRTKPNSGKQVSFLNDTTWKLDPPGNPYGSSSSTQEAASTMAPGRGKMMFTGQSTDGQAANTKFTAPSTIERSRAVNRDGVLSSGPNDPDGKECRQQSDSPHGEGKKVKRRKEKVLKKQAELQAKTVLRATKRIKKLARSSSFIYGSDDEATVSESDESRTDKKTVKLSDLRDKAAESQCTNLLEVGAEGNTEKRHLPLKYGIKLSSTTGKLILRRHGQSKDP